MLDYLVKLGQGEYAKRYVQAAPIAEIPGYVLDSFVELTALASHCQAMASAASCSLHLTTAADAIADLTKCVEYAERVIGKAQETAKLPEQKGAK